MFTLPVSSTNAESGFVVKNNDGLEPLDAYHLTYSQISASVTLMVDPCHRSATESELAPWTVNKL